MTKEKKIPEEIKDADLDQAQGGAQKIFVKVDGMPGSFTESGGKGTPAMTEEIEMVIERLERG